MGGSSKSYQRTIYWTLQALFPKKGHQSTTIFLVHTQGTTYRALIDRLTWLKSCWWACLTDPANTLQISASLMQTFSPQPAAVTHLDGLVQESRVGEVVSVDVVSGGVYVHSSHDLVRDVWLCRQKDSRTKTTDFIQTFLWGDGSAHVTVGTIGRFSLIHLTPNTEWIRAHML